MAKAKQQTITGTDLPELERANEKRWRIWHKIAKLKLDLKEAESEVQAQIHKALHDKKLATPLDLTQPCTVWGYTGTGPDKEPVARRVVFKPVFALESDSRTAEQPEESPE